MQQVKQKKKCVRSVFIRETDYRKLKTQAYACGYTNVSWDPISIHEIGKKIVILTLKDELRNTDPFLSDREVKDKWYPKWNIHDPEYSARLYITHLRKSGKLYDTGYVNYSWLYENDNIYIRYRKDSKWTRMGLATLERDYEI